MQRVTNSMVQISTLADMHTNLNRLLKLQQQLSSGKLYDRPSDNPVAVTRELSLDTSIFENEQYVSNMERGVTLLENTESALDQITSVVQRIRELTVYAGNGALEDVDMEAIAQELAELKEELRLTANYSVEGRYLLSGLATDTVPFQYDEDGNVVYMGNDYNIYFETERGSEGKVALDGLEVFPTDVTQYVLESVEVPIDFEWTGRSEVLQFQVGDRTAKVLIPEKWTDDDGSNGVDDTDYNRFRDSGELEGYTLDKIAEIINSSLAMGDVGRLVSVEVVKDEAAGVQKLVVHSHTGEPVQLTSWPSTDAEELSQGIEGIDVDLTTPLTADGTLTFGWDDGTTSTIDVTTADSLQDIADRISAEVPDMLARVVEDGMGNGRLVLFNQEEGETFYLTATDGAKDLLSATPPTEDLVLASEAVEKTLDHSHIDLTSLFRMETTVKSTEVNAGFSIDTTTSALHWRLESGSNRAEVLVNDDADLTLEELATRIRNIAGDWLEVTVETDEQDQGLSPSVSGGTNEENATQRLVIRTLDGESLVLYDKTTTAGADYASQLGVSTVTKGVTGGTFPSGSGLDETLPALVSVTVGDKEYTVKLYREDVTTGGTNALDGVKVAEEIVRQVNEQYGDELLGMDDLGGGEFVLYADTGEPLRITDLPFGDPDLKADEYGGGIAMQLGLTTGVIGGTVSDAAVGAANAGTFRISTLGRTVEIPVLDTDTPQTIAEKIRLNAGNWLDVSFVDSDMSTAGGTAQIALSAKDGSPVSVLDISGNAAQYLELDNTIRAELGGTLPTAGNLEITVDGYTHSIDLSEIRDFDSSGTVDYNDLVAAINTRFQGQDIRAELLDDGGTSYLALVSDQGYGISVTDTSGTLITGGVTTTQVRNGPLSDNTPCTQNVTVRTAANQNQTNFFGLMDDLTSAVTSEDREGISNALLGKIDDFLDNLLRQRTEVGALVQRYESSQARLTTNTTALTDLQSKVGDTDLAEAITKYQMAQSVYSASLAVIAQIVQPTLVDFLS